MPWDDDIDWYPVGEYNPGYDGYEGGYLGGDSDGSIGSPTDPGTAGFDWSQLLKPFSGAALSEGSGWLEKLLKGAGLATTNKDGSLNLGSLLGLLAATGGGINAMNVSKDSAAKWEAAANKSNEFAQGQYEKAQERFKPFIDSGLGALAQLSAGTPTLADKFVSKGAPSSLASLIKPR